jgi:type I restriction enzyme S subunit
MPGEPELIRRERGIGAGDQAGVRTTEVPFSVLRTIECFIPMGTEQSAIADVLDSETARIDTLIEEQERLIELLRERRRDLVRVAVLGHGSPFSLGAGAAAVGRHYSVTLGKMLDAGKGRRDGDQVLPYVRAANVQDSGLRLDDVNSMPYSASEAATLNLLRGDLVVVEGGAVGTCAVIEADMPGWSFQKTLNRVRASGGGSTEWLAWVLRTYRDARVFDIICSGSTIPHLTAEKLRSLRIPNTPVVQQIAIAERLRVRTSEIDELIAETERFIALSLEHRSALITAAVTGQIDVRDPHPAEVV